MMVLGQIHGEIYIFQQLLLYLEVNNVVLEAPLPITMHFEGNGIKKMWAYGLNIQP